MLDCLPSPEDWSPESQYLMLKEHLQAMQHHLDVLTKAGLDSAVSLAQEGPHLKEINQRCLDAYELLDNLSKQPQSVLAALNSEEQNA